MLSELREDFAVNLFGKRIQLKVTLENYLIHTKDSFDRIADTFDAEDYSNEILQWMRNVVYKIYLSYFKEGDNLLELNAGTGIDAVEIASKGIKVFATDISSAMLDKLNEKIKSEKLDSMIKTENYSFNDINKISEKDFDGAISNFGGLNCINDFSNLSQALYERLKPNAKFIAVIMNSFCPWEIFYFLLKLDLKNSFRRFRKEGIEANLSQFKIKSFYFTPKEFAEHFKKNFTIDKIYSLGLFTPPPYLYGIYHKAKYAVKACMFMDDITKKIFPFNRIGDNFVIVLKRNEN